MKSLRWKIEKRALQRIGQVLRMENDRLTKAGVFGSLTDLEQHPDRRGKSRETTFYWKKLISEAGWDWKNIDDKAKDRPLWKKLVKERMNHLETWERKKGYEGPTTKRWIETLHHKHQKH